MLEIRRGWNCSRSQHRLMVLDGMSPNFCANFSSRKLSRLSKSESSRLALERHTCVHPKVSVVVHLLTTLYDSHICRTFRDVLLTRNWGFYFKYSGRVEILPSLMFHVILNIILFFKHLFPGCQLQKERKANHEYLLDICSCERMRVQCGAQMRYEFSFPCALGSFN